MFKKKQANVSEKVSNGMTPLQSKDDALFETLNRNKKEKKKKLIRTVVTIIIIIAIILVVGISVLRRQVREQFGGEAQEVQPLRLC